MVAADKNLCAACYKESLRQERLGKQHKTIAALDEMDNSDMEDVGVPLDEAEIPETEIPELDSSFDDDDEGYIDEDRENGDD